MQIVPTPNPTLNHYYAALANYTSLGVTHEQGIRSAFRSLLEKFSRSAEPTGWTLVEEHTLPGSRKRPDGTLLSSHAKESRYFVPTCARISLTLRQSVSKFR